MDNKIEIGKFIGEAFTTYLKSLPSLFKNNWLLIAIIIVGCAIIGFFFIPHEGVEKRDLYEFPIWFYMPLSYLLYGYVFRYIINGTNQPMGLGGLYFNMPLAMIIASIILFGLVVGILGIAIGGIAMGLYSLMPTTITAVSLAIPIIMFMIWLSCRFITLMPYCFLHNKIDFSAPFKQTRGNVLRIFIIFFVIVCITQLFHVIAMAIIVSGLAKIIGTSLSSALLGLVHVVAGYLPLVVTALLYKHLKNLGDQNEKISRKKNAE